MKQMEDNRIFALRGEIEKVRTELNALFVSEEYEKYTEKSRELDKLIEEYIDLEDELGILNVQ